MTTLIHDIEKGQVARDVLYVSNQSVWEGFGRLCQMSQQVFDLTLMKYGCVFSRQLLFFSA